MTASKFHKTNSLAEIQQSGIVQGRTEGHVYAVAPAGRNLTDGASDIVEFRNAAAALFARHPATLSFWGAWKKFIRKEWRSVAMGDIHIVNSWMEGQGHLVVDNAKIVPLVDGALLLSRARLASRWILMEPLSILASWLVFVQIALDQFWPDQIVYLAGLTWFVVASHWVFWWWLVQDAVYRLATGAVQNVLGDGPEHKVPRQTG